MSTSNPTTASRHVQRPAVLVVRNPRHGDLAVTVRKAERWVLGIAAIVVIVWVVAHLAAVFAAVALLATGRRVLHL
jgi:hypothetical protein